MAASALTSAVLEHRDRLSEVTALKACDSAPPVPAHAGNEAVSDGFGVRFAFLARGSCGDRVPRQACRVGVPREDLAQPPAVAQLPGHVERLGDVRQRRTDVERGRGYAGSERAGEQNGIVEFARDGERFLRLVDAR